MRTQRVMMTLLRSMAAGTPCPRRFYMQATRNTMRELGGLDALNARRRDRLQDAVEQAARVGKAERQREPSPATMARGDESADQPRDDGEAKPGDEAIDRHVGHEGGRLA